MNKKDKTIARLEKAFEIDENKIFKLTEKISHLEKTLKKAKRREKRLYIALESAEKELTKELEEETMPTFNSCN